MDRFSFRNAFESPDELNQFAGEVIQKLHRAELYDAAKILEDWRSNVYTTSSEWLGELGLAIRKIQKQNEIDQSLNLDLERLLCAVHRAWPSI
jgi:hypothetical protein